MKKYAEEERKKKEAQGEKMADEDLDSWMKEENERTEFSKIYKIRKLKNRNSIN